MDKSNIEYKHFSNWKELHSCIDEYFCHFKNYIFRGQSNQKWLLEPTLTRKLKIFYKNPHKWNQLTENILNDFKKSIIGRCNSNPNNYNENELWELAQHHGMYTPLLDWTRSPYVALFFSLSCLSEDQKDDCALWALCFDDIVRINTKNKENKKSNKLIEVIEPSLNENKRIINQNGLMLKMPIGMDIENWINGIYFEWVTLYKFTFSPSIKRDALLALDNMNINFATIFPDLIGASLHCNFKFENWKYLDNMQKLVWKTSKNVLIVK